MEGSRNGKRKTGGTTAGVFGSDQDGDGNDGNYDGDKDSNDYTDTNNAVQQIMGSESAKKTG